MRNLCCNLWALPIKKIQFIIDELPYQEIQHTIQFSQVDFDLYEKPVELLNSVIKQIHSVWVSNDEKLFAPKVKSELQKIDQLYRLHLQVFPALVTTQPVHQLVYKKLIALTSAFKLSFNSLQLRKKQTNSAKEIFLSLMSDYLKDPELDQDILMKLDILVRRRESLLKLEVNNVFTILSSSRENNSVPFFKVDASYHSKAISMLENAAKKLEANNQAALVAG